MKKKKKLYIGLIIVILIVGCSFYVKPLRLADLARENQYIVITYQELGVRNGSPYINSTNYNEITEDEKGRITDIFRQYSYKRGLATLFSNGSLTEPGSRLVNIYVYNEDMTLENTIFIADSDTVSVNGKVYTLKQSSLFIDELMGAVSR